MKLAYMRVSTDRQDTQIQLDAIRATKPNRIYKDVDTGTNTARTQYKKLCGAIEVSNEPIGVVIWKLDRLSRDFFETMRFFEVLRNKEVMFISLTEPYLDGFVHEYGMEKKILLAVCATKAEMEVRDLKLRVRGGIDRAQAAGVHCGRPSKEMIKNGWKPKERR